MMVTRLDPKQLRESTDCPFCRASFTFRPKGLLGQWWMKRCTKCGRRGEWPLPKIKKSIIYLDQFVISNMVKAKEPFWTELHKKLNALAALQLITCPYSEVHNDESVLSYDLRDDLKKTYRSFGGDDCFRRTCDIEQTQLLRSIRRWLRVAHSDETVPLWSDAFERDPHSWTGDFQVFVDFPVHEPWVTDVRNRKQEIHADVKSVCECIGCSSSQ